jgi:CBS domain-containing protein
VIVQEVMSENPVSVQLDTRVSEIIEMLMEIPIRHIPVLDGDVLRGIVSDRDLKAVSLPRLVDGQALSEIRARYGAPISDLMSSDPVTVHPETDLAEAVDLMLEHKIGALPVVDPSSGDLVGIVSYVDVLRACRELLMS